jgi:nucleoside-diphosphate-sugar epimerase
MSPFRFIKWIESETPLTLYGDGKQSRDFTYIDDIAEGIIKAYQTETGYEIINLGNDDPHELNEFIRLIEQTIGKTAIIEKQPFHKADMMATWADITKAKRLLDWSPSIALREGIQKTVDWYITNKTWATNISTETA